MKEIASLDGGSAKKTAVKPPLTKRNKLDLHPLYASLAAFFLFLFVLLIFKKYPLGDDSFLLSDLEAQYAPFLVLMRNKILELGGVPKEHLLSYLTYSFKLGLGKNLAGTIGYYLASPFNLICLILDESQIDIAVLMIISSKLSLASGFMCFFLEKRFDDKKTLWPVLLGIMYAYSSYARIYIFNIMWLDGFMLLPLILYFTEKFIEKRKYTALIILFLSLFITNYYIAYMAGISCFLYLCVRMFEKKVPIKEAAGICVRYVLTAVFTAMITAALLVPVGLDTIKNSDQTLNSYNYSLIMHTPISFIHSFLLGEPRDFDLLSGNYPFFFISLSVTIMLLVYIFSPVFNGREKKTHIFCVLGVLLSTFIFQIDKAWQAFDEPNWFWHRQVFAFLPLFLIITYRVLMKIKDVARKDILKVMLILYLLVVIDFSIGAINGNREMLEYNLALITAYSAILIGYGLKTWPQQLKDMPKMLSPLLVGIICFELTFVGNGMSSSIDAMTLRKGSAIELSNSIKAQSEFGSYARENNTGSGAFRAEDYKSPDYTVEYYAEHGESFYGNYNGVAFFNSSSNKNAHRFMKQLGFLVNYNYFSVWHSYSNPSVDSFFSVGSLSSREDLNYYRQEGEDSVGTGLKFYSNDNVLPLAFAANQGASDFDFYRLEKDTEEKDYFALQNDWYRSLFPDQFVDDIYVEYGEDIVGEPKIINAVSFNTHDYVTHRYLISQNGNSNGSAVLGSGSVDPLGQEQSVAKELNKKLTDLYRSNENAPIIVEYEFKAPSDDTLYCSLTTAKILDETDIYVNGVKVSGFSSGRYYSTIIDLGTFNEGDDVKVTFWSNKDKGSYLNIRVASFDNETFSNQFAGIDKTKVKTDAVSDGYVKFNINGLDADETVITTIPVEDGWQLYIDGNPAEYKAYQNAFISFDASSGNHTAELVFTAPGLKTGAMISCAGVVLLAAFLVVDGNISKKKKPTAVKD